MQLDKTQIENLDRKYRLNLINSVTGIKPANLIASRSLSGKDNVAIFSSVVHLGSSPAQLGFVMRPQGDEPRDTFANIQETGYYSINHISASFIKEAHYTSAKLARGVSEFERMNLTKEELASFPAPFVQESFVKIGMKFVEALPLSNACTFIVGDIVLLNCPDEALNELGQLDLEHYNCAGISGLNTYYKFKKLASFPYVRNHEIPDFK